MEFVDFICNFFLIVGTKDGMLVEFDCIFIYVYLWIFEVELERW